MYNYKALQGGYVFCKRHLVIQSKTVKRVKTFYFISLFLKVGITNLYIVNSCQCYIKMDVIWRLWYLRYPLKKGMRKALFSLLKLVFNLMLCSRISTFGARDEWCILSSFKTNGVNKLLAKRVVAQKEESAFQDVLRLLKENPTENGQQERRKTELPVWWKNCATV